MRFKLLRFVDSAPMRRGSRPASVWDALGVIAMLFAGAGCGAQPTEEIGRGSQSLSATEIAFVQINSAVPQSPESRVVVPFSAAQSAGDLNVIIVGWNDGSAQLSSVTDTAGNPYQLVVGPTRQDNKLTQSIYCAKNIVASAADANSVTVTFDIAAAYPDIRIVEYAGIDPNNPVDVVGASTGSSATSSSGAITTTNPNDLIVGANMVLTSSLSAGSGFTSRIITNPDGDIEEDRIVSTAGSYSATSSLSGAADWVMQVVAFRGAASDGSDAGGSQGSADPPPEAGAGDPTPPGTSATPVFIQGNSAVPAFATTITIPYLSAQAAGDLNVVFVGWNDDTSSVATVTDTRGNVYTRAVGPNVMPGTLSQSIYYAKNILGATANGNAVTVGFTSSALFPDIRILEYAGIDTTNPLDVAAGSQGAGSLASTGAVTTTNANDLLVAGNMTTGLTYGAGTGYISRILTFPDSDIAEDRIVTAAGSSSATAPVSDGSVWVMQLAAFRAAGGSAPPPSDTGPAQAGLWSGTVSFPIVPVNIALMSNEKILMWDAQSWGYDARVWDWTANTFTSVQAPANMFCSGLEQLADGRIAVVGGHTGAHLGLTALNIFDPNTSFWTVGPDMSYPRWYPTATTLPDGRVLVLSGESACDGCFVDVPELYDPASNNWTRLTSARFSFSYYPHVYTLNDGRVLVSSTDETPTQSQILDLGARTWTPVGGPAVDGGASTMYAPSKILKSGTSEDPDQPVMQATADAYVLDATQANAVWRPIAPMNNRRTYHSFTVLPDGNVLVTGGGPTTAATDTANAILAAEMWSPATEGFTTLASMHAPRLYHSEALLMPDGRVLVSGGGRFDDATLPTDQFSGEFYSPPYLFKGPRPVIASAPATVHYGQAFLVATPDASRIASVSMMRLGAATHGVNMGQHYVPLSFTGGSSQLTVNGPVNGNFAPPGYYMLFLVDTNGVPSVAAIVRL